MSSNRGTPTKMTNEKIENEGTTLPNMKERLDVLEKEYTYINELIAVNLKTFDVIMQQFSGNSY